MKAEAPSGAMDDRAAGGARSPSASSAPASSWLVSSRSRRAFPARPTTWRRSPGPAEVGGRLGEISPLVAAALAAAVVASIVLMLATRRLRPLAAASELIVLGAAIEVCVLGAIGRIGYATDGSVLLAGIFSLTGGVSVLAAGLLAALVPNEEPVRPACAAGPPRSWRSTR